MLPISCCRSFDGSLMSSGADLAGVDGVAPDLAELLQLTRGGVRFTRTLCTDENRDESRVQGRIRSAGVNQEYCAESRAPGVNQEHQGEPRARG